jgi:hypothetical protein
LVNYQNKKYDIYLAVTKDNLSTIFSNKSFHNFISLDKKFYFCMYELIHQTKNHSYTYGVMYLHYTQDYNFEKVIKYCWENKILDLITIHDEFDKQVYTENKFIKGSGNLKFYIMNQIISQIDKNKNGLVTI